MGPIRHERPRRKTGWNTDTDHRTVYCVRLRASQRKTPTFGGTANMREVPSPALLYGRQSQSSEYGKPPYQILSSSLLPHITETSRSFSHETSTSILCETSTLFSTTDQHELLRHPCDGPVRPLRLRGIRMFCGTRKLLRHLPHRSGLSLRTTLRLLRRRPIGCTDQYCNSKTINIAPKRVRTTTTTSPSCYVPAFDIP